MGLDLGFQGAEQTGSGLKFLQMVRAVFSWNHRISNVWKRPERLSSPTFHFGNAFGENSYVTQESPDPILKNLLKPMGFPY